MKKLIILAGVLLIVKALSAQNVSDRASRNSAVNAEGKAGPKMKCVNKNQHRCESRSARNINQGASSKTAIRRTTVKVDNKK